MSTAREFNPSRFFRVTYETVTPESAEHGDYEDHGFIMPGEWKYSANVPEYQADDYTMTLREAMQLAYPNEDSGRWFSETDESRCDYSTGAVETRSIHPPHNISGASYARLKRLMGIR